MITNIQDPDVICDCVVLNRKDMEEMRDWMKRCMCQHHWMQTDYYQTKLMLESNILTGQLLDLIKMMPDEQTEEIMEFITKLRATRRMRDAHSTPKTR